jgi:ribonuclease HI
MAKRTCITIYTDASMCPKTGAMGWAAWIKWSAEGRKEISGSLILEKPCSTLAELTAIYIAVQHVSQTMNTERCHLVVVTDSLNSQQTLKGQPSQYSEFRKKILGCLQPHTSLAVNKVKAHSNKDGVRSWVNSRVDELAGIQMRQLREQLKKEAV